MKLFLGLLLIHVSFFSVANKIEDEIQIAHALDSFHQAAANAQTKIF